MKVTFVVNNIQMDWSWIFTLLDNTFRLFDIVRWRSVSKRIKSLMDDEDRWKMMYLELFVIPRVIPNCWRLAFQDSYSKFPSILVYTDNQKNVNYIVFLDSICSILNIMIFD